MKKKWHNEASSCPHRTTSPLGVLIQRGPVILTKELPTESPEEKEGLPIDAAPVVTMRQLRDFFPSLPLNWTLNRGDWELCGLTEDSREVRAGFVFVAIPGVAQDGATFIENALQRGASVVVALPSVCQLFHRRFPHVVFFPSEEIRQSLAHLSALFFPLRPPFIAAITGTNGKSSITGLAYQLWQFLKIPSFSCGTLGVKCDDIPQKDLPIPPALTTMNAPKLHQFLSIFGAKGIKVGALEAASHGLDQKRLDALKFQLGVFSNFSQDHLDYHKTSEAYLEAKLHLFKQLIEPGGIALLHNNLPSQERLHALCAQANLRVWTYGGTHTDLACLNLQNMQNGQKVTLKLWKEEFTLFIPLVGHCQVDNLMAAIAIVHASGVPIEQIIPFAPLLTSTPGRFEHMGRTKEGGDVYVDFAHTPEALEQVLKTLRQYTSGKLGVVFGCGGNRDHSKRPVMGKIASLNANWVVITDDNPRTEDPSIIRHDILKECPQGFEIPDRKEAITWGMGQLEEGDTLVIAGRGHETHQIKGTEQIALDDRQIVQSCLKGKQHETSDTVVS